ncbi:MAG: hypothetical protein WCR13_02545 [Sphaerochaeta sp.]
MWYIETHPVESAILALLQFPRRVERNDAHLFQNMARRYTMDHHAEPCTARMACDRPEDLGYRIERGAVGNPF